MAEQLYPPAKDKGGSNFPLAYGEYLVGCPYDKSHRALNTRVQKHLDKCRKNYILGLAQRKEPLIKLSCKHDHRHQVYAPEILFHEYSCGKDHSSVLVDHLLMREMERMKQTGAVGDLEEAVHKSEYAAQIVDIFQRQPTPLTVVKELTFSDPKIARSRGITPFSAAKLEDLDAAFAIRRTRLRPRQAAESADEKKSKFPGRAEEDKEEEEEEEEWKADANEPGFDWLQNWYQLKKPIYSFPPGLTKAQRKVFIDINTVRMASELGRFDAGTLGKGVISGGKDGKSTDADGPAPAPSQDHPLLPTWALA